MLEPITAIGLAGNIVQLVELGVHIIGKGKELANTGSTDERRHLERLAEETSMICAEIKGQVALSRRKDPDSDKAISDLASQTKTVANELKDLMSQLSLNPLNHDEDRPKKRQKAAVGKVLKSVWKGYWKEEDILRLRRTMMELQQDMILRLSTAQLASTSELMGSMNAVAKGLETSRFERLEGYESMLPLIQERVKTSTAEMNDDVNTKSFTARMDECMKQAQLAATCRRVVESLSFDEIHRRHDAIEVAHESTFKWIFDQNTTSFSDWALNKRGAFWVTGKPGSGKSTLMKYIVDHPRTMELLRMWAGDDELIAASHFFWIAGSPMQKSREGLLRTLLFQMIRQSPELVGELVPGRFKTNLFQRGLPWTQEELEATIKAFGLNKRSGVKLCMFIDGLDEYQGEHADLIELISSIASSPQIKVCVSSRPWNLFTRAYHKQTDGQLAVQDLTRADIEAYIKDKLNQDALFRELLQRDKVSCLGLIEDITVKAQGVFLWVYLVVRSLLRGLTNDDELKTLQDRIADYPPTLDGYFQRMFDRIEPVYLKQGARLIIMCMLSGGLHYFAPKCIDLEMDNPDYALAIEVPPSREDASLMFGCSACSLISEINVGWKAHKGSGTHTFEFMHPEVKGKDVCFFMSNLREDLPDSRHIEKLQRTLDARCGDLLEVCPPVSLSIGFIHRTAEDFIGKDGMMEWLYSLAGADHDLGLSLARYKLVLLKEGADVQKHPDPAMEIGQLDCMSEGGDDLVWDSNLAAYAALLDDFDEKVGVAACHDKAYRAVEKLKRPQRVRNFLAKRQRVAGIHDSSELANCS